jgi:hypothetical protein
MARDDVGDRGDGQAPLGVDVEMLVAVDEQTAARRREPAERGEERVEDRLGDVLDGLDEQDEVEAGGGCFRQQLDIRADGRAAGSQRGGETGLGVLAHRLGAVSGPDLDPMAGEERRRSRARRRSRSRARARPRRAGPASR